MNMLNSLQMMISAVGDYTGINIFRDILVILMVLLAIARQILIWAETKVKTGKES